MADRWNELKRRLAQVQNLQNASALLGWDQQTYMPPHGASARAEQLAALDKLAHELFTSDEIGELLESVQDQSLDYDSDEASLVRVTKRDYDKARRVPPELVEEIARTSSLAIESWTKALADSSFAEFLPSLEKIVELEIELAERLGYKERIYDALLDQYEPGMTAAQVQEIFEKVKRELISLVQKISTGSEPADNSVLCREYDEQKQWDFGLEVIKRFGFDFQGGRQDRSVHPFTTSMGLGDTRITTRVDREYLPTSLFGTLHECGHALYDMGYRSELEGTPLAGGATLGVHESQSRLWENLVGRSRGFWKYFYPGLQGVFPTQLGDVSLESFYRAVNQVKPSFIRVEADEVTYNLHIMLRFEIENDLIEQRIRVADIPERWNTKMTEYLGIVPRNDAEGCLQDIHWAIASFGYFPTYSLGNLLSVQLFNQAVLDRPSIPNQIANGEFTDLLGWLRERVHRHGRKFTLNEISMRATGQPLGWQPYVAYLRDKYGEIYSL